MLKECEDDDDDLSEDDDENEDDEPCGPFIKICSYSDIEQSPNPAVKEMLDYIRSYKDQAQEDTMLEANSKQKFRRYLSRQLDIHEKLRDEALTASYGSGPRGCYA